MISQDAIKRSAWHDQQFQEARKRVLDAMAYNLGHGYRLQHPTYRGLPDNSTGSKNRPFFAMKDEANVPLVPKATGAGNPGALWNPAGRKYAKEILQRRAIDTTAQEEGMEPPQVVPPAQEEPSFEKKLELNNMVKQLAISINQGRFSDITFDLYRKVLMVLLAVIPFMDGAELADLYGRFEDIERVSQNQLSERVDDRAPSEEAFLETMKQNIQGVTKLLDEYILRTEGPLTRKQRVRSLNKKVASQTFTIDEKRTILKELVKKYVDKKFDAVIPPADRSTEFVDEVEGGEQIFDALMSINDLLNDDPIDEEAVLEQLDIINVELDTEIDITDEDGSLLPPARVRRRLKDLVKAETGYVVNFRRNNIELNKPRR